MRLHPFRLLEPESLPEAVEAIGRLDGEARLIAGGTALVAMIRLGLVKPDRLISLHRVPGLNRIRVDGDALELGAMATHADIERSRTVRDGWPLLADAVHRVATPAIRTSGTIGGNLAYAEAASDPAPALLCLNAEVKIAGPKGEHRVPVGRFFRGFYDAALEPGEMVSAVRVPPAPAGARGGYVKFTSRSAEDKPLVGSVNVRQYDELTVDGKVYWKVDQKANEYVLASAISDPDEIRRRLIEQVTGTVRWRESVAYMAGQGVTKFFEIGAGKVLSGLIKRIANGATTNAIGSPEDVVSFKAGRTL